MSELKDPKTGEIIETPSSYILVKNPSIEPADRMGFQDVIVTWGNDNGHIKIREIEYPKVSYSYDRMMAIQNKLIDCPYCQSGYNLTKLSKDKSGITQVFDPIFKSASSQWGISTKFLSSIAGAFLYSQLGSLAIDYIFTPGIGTVFVKIAVGVILLIASVLIKGKKNSSEGRLKEELYAAGLMFIARALNLSDLELVQLQLGRLNITQVIAEKGILAGLGAIGRNMLKPDIANYFVTVKPEEVTREEALEAPNRSYQLG